MNDDTREPLSERDNNNLNNMAFTQLNMPSMYNNRNHAPNLQYRHPAYSPQPKLEPIYWDSCPRRENHPRRKDHPRREDHHRERRARRPRRDDRSRSPPARSRSPPTRSLNTQQGSCTVPALTASLYQQSVEHDKATVALKHRAHEALRDANVRYDEQSRRQTELKSFQ